MIARYQIQHLILLKISLLSIQSSLLLFLASFVIVSFGWGYWMHRLMTSHPNE